MWFIFFTRIIANLLLNTGSKREAVRKLEEENNLLKAKLELVMDMVSRKNNLMFYICTYFNHRISLRGSTSPMMANMITWR